MRLTIVDSSRQTSLSSGRLEKRQDGRLALAARPIESIDAATPARFVSPGWVDLHAHVYDGVTQISVSANRVGLNHGVHLIADAGSAGQATLRGLTDYVAPQADTTITCWVNIGSHGLVHLRETAEPDFIDVDATIAAIDAAREFVCGVKVRSSGQIVGAMGLQPLQLGRLVARQTSLPLMVHIGEAPPMIDEVLDLLDAGDVATHCYHGKTGTPWLPDGTPIPALRRALDRGVLLDVGHGAASFSAQVARAAVVAGFMPNSISTDIHVRSIHGPVHNLATVMTKLLDCGMPLPDVIAAVTTSPRMVLKAPEPWLGDDGEIRHATVFELADRSPDGRTYRDADGQIQAPVTHVVPIATIAAGVWRDCGE